MTKKFILILLFWGTVKIVFCQSIHYNSNSNFIQNESIPLMSISEDWLIQILESNNQPASNAYLVDISGIPFKEKSVAKHFFSSIESNLISFDLHYEQSLVVIRLNDISKSIQEWNRILSQESARYLDYYQRFKQTKE